MKPKIQYQYEYQKPYQQRRNLGNALAVNWIKHHRPDIWKAIQEEVDKAVPTRVSKREPFQLPATLEKLA